MTEPRTIEDVRREVQQRLERTENIITKFYEQGGDLRVDSRFQQMVGRADAFHALLAFIDGAEGAGDAQP